MRSRTAGGRRAHATSTAAVGATVLVAATLFMRPVSAEADALPAIDRHALDRHMTDLTNCLAYYSIAQHALESAGEQPTARRVEEVRRTLLDRSFIVMQAVEMDEETALARQEQAVQEQLALIDNDLDKFATLTEKYGTFCKDVVEDPRDRLEQWKERLENGRRE